MVFSKRHEVSEARMRVFCMTDDKEDKTLEHQEHFQEVAKSRDVEVRGLLRLYLLIYYVMMRLPVTIEPDFLFDS